MKITVYNKLRKYESYMYSAVNCNFIRSMNIKQVEELEEIAKELNIQFKYNHCPKCLLDLMKKFGNGYFEQKKKLEDKKKGEKNEG